MFRFRRFDLAMSLLGVLIAACLSAAPLKSIVAKEPPPIIPKDAPKEPRAASKIGDMWTNSLGMKFAYIPAGEFDMGSPVTEAGRFDDETQHHVKLTKPKLIATTHVTRAQFAQFVNEAKYQTDAEKAGWAWQWTGEKEEKVKGGSWRNPGFPQGDDHPVVDMSWNDSTAFCVWLSQKEHRKYRLPTEAEWEYACRAGAKTAYPWGDKPDDGKGWANCADQTLKAKFPDWTWVTFNWTDGYVYTSPVASFKPNAWGLYDMIGNAWEWCSDVFAEYPPGAATDPTGPVQDGAHLLRGGSWIYSPRNCRCASRDQVASWNRFNYSGFRLVLDFD